MAVLLALDHARVAGEESALLQHRAKADFVKRQRLRDSVAHGTGLPRKTSARYRARNIELSVAVCGNQWLTYDHSQHRPREIDGFFLAIHLDATAAWLDPDASDRILALAGRIGPAPGIAVILRLLPRIGGRFSWLRLDQRGFEIAEALHILSHGHSALR